MRYDLERAEQTLASWRALQVARTPVQIVQDPTPAPAVRRLYPRGKDVQRSASASHSGRSAGLGRAERTFLTVLARRTGKDTARNQLAVIAGYSSKSAHVDNILSALRTAGYVEGGRQALAITQAGRAALGDLEPMPTGRALVAQWVGQLDRAAGSMLQKLVDVYPQSMSRDELATATGYSITSAHVDNSISTLRTRDLVLGGRGELRASAELFE